MKNPALQAVQDFIRKPYTFPGGYPLILIMQDGGTLCRDCARTEYRLISDSTRKSCRDGWQAEAVDIHWEGPPVSCDHCGSITESAYGDPETDEQP